MASRDYNYSRLEVVQTEHNPNDKFLDERARHSTLETIPATEKEAFVTNTTEYSHDINDAIPIVSQKKSRRKLYTIAGVVVLVIAVIVGVVCGVLLGNKASELVDSLPPSISPFTNSTEASMFGNASLTNDYRAPTAATWGWPHMDLFVTNDSGSPLWLPRPITASSPTDWNVTGADSGSFTYLGGVALNVTNSLSAIARGGNHTDVFTVGTTRNLWQKYRNDGIWGPSGDPWFSVDSNAVSQQTLYSAPGVASWAEDRVDVFAIGQNGALWQYFWISGEPWNGWIAIGGDFALNFAPTVASWGSERYDLFLVNANSSLGYKYYDGAWLPSDLGEFYNLGGQVTSRPCVVAPTVGQLGVFARGGDAGLWYLQFNGKWGSWTRLGAAGDKIKGDPSAVVLGDDVHVLAWGEDDSLLIASWPWKSGPGNITFTKLASGLEGAPFAVTDGVNVEVFAYMPDNKIGWKYLVGGQWMPDGLTMAGMWQYQ